MLLIFNFPFRVTPHHARFVIPARATIVAPPTIGLEHRSLCHDFFQFDRIPLTLVRLGADGCCSDPIRGGSWLLLLTGVDLLRRPMRPGDSTRGPIMR